MKRFAIPTAALIIIAILAVVMFRGQTARALEPLTLGAVLPLTGDLAGFGTEAQRGVQLAIDQKNQAGGVRGMAVSVVTEDDQNQPSTATSALQKLISVNHVPAVVGSIGSSVTLALAPIAHRSQVVLISPMASNPLLADEGPYVFKLWPSDVDEAAFIANAMRTQFGINRLMILYNPNGDGYDSWLGVADIVATAFDRAGGDVLAIEPYDEFAGDCRALLTKVRGEAPDAVYLADNYRGVARMLMDARPFGFQVFAGSKVQSPELLRLAGLAANGLVYARPAFDPNNPTDRYRRFAEAFNNRYGTAPGFGASYGFDAATLVLMVADQVPANQPITGQALQQRLHDMRNVTGVTGWVSFDPSGNRPTEFGLFTVRDGNFRPYGG